MPRFLRALTFFVFCAVCGIPAFCEEPSSLRMDVEFLSDPVCAGRATGTRGAVEAAQYIGRRFRQAGLEPRIQGFVENVDGREVCGRNVIAEYRKKGARRWIVLTAYYDGLGEREGVLYPGADSNASGVAALLEAADSLVHSESGYNFLFVALDGHAAGFAGARRLWEATLSGREVRMVVNLDIIGSSLAPVQPYFKQYVMAVGAVDYRKKLDALAEERGLRVYYDYYRSKDFTDLFFRRLGDQKVFLEHGLPVVWFTSGITMNTNKATDTAGTLDYDQLSRRMSLVLNWINAL